MGNIQVQPGQIETRQSVSEPVRRTPETPAPIPEVAIAPDNLRIAHPPAKAFNLQNMEDATERSRSWNQLSNPYIIDRDMPSLLRGGTVGAVAGGVVSGAMSLCLLEGLARGGAEASKVGLKMGITALALTTVGALAGAVSSQTTQDRRTGAWTGAAVGAVSFAAVAALRGNTPGAEIILPMLVGAMGGAAGTHIANHKGTTETFKSLIPH